MMEYCGLHPASTLNQAFLMMTALSLRFPTLRALAGSIDLSLLDLSLTDALFLRLCDGALQWKFASVCVRPNWVPTVEELLRGSSVRVCAVISFHEGQDSIDHKITMARAAIARGAQEIDWVLDHKFLHNDYGKEPLQHTHLEVQALASIQRDFPGVITKGTVECCALGGVHKRWICELFVGQKTIGRIKTSTGWGTPRNHVGPIGATVEDVALFRGIIEGHGSSMRIEASVGILDLDTLLTMADAGATRFGIRHAAAMSIMEEARAAGLTA